MPSNSEELAEIKQRFYRMVRPHGIPNVIGLIDGTHCKIYSPGGVDAERYRNRKGYFSINVQVVGGPDLKVLDIEARWPGSAHDSYIYDMSCIKMKFFRGDFGNSYLLGDGGYANTMHMLTPLTAPSTPGERAYQRAHISMRNGVERLFGVAKRRFPSLAFGLQINVNTSLSVIVACFILHNVAIINNDAVNDFEIIDEELPVQEVHENVIQNIDARNHVIHTYFANI
uniref:CSON012463 protein n=1 Tax=Culicoides sonorensis TaxID=179676 RepID=A0A336MB16_CULSO